MNAARAGGARRPHESGAARAAGRGAALLLCAVLALGAGTALAQPTHRLGGGVSALYRHDSGTLLGRSFRNIYFDRRLDLGLGGNLLGPRLGNYQLATGLDFLSQKGPDGTHDDTRPRLEGRLNLLPQSPVTLTSFYAGNWSNQPVASLQSARSDSWGGGVGSRILPRGTSSFDYEKREDHLGGALDAARTWRAHHGQSVVLGPHALNASYDYTERRQSSGLARLDFDTRRHTGRLDGHLDLAALGKLDSWLQLDRENARTIAGTLPDRTLENRAASGNLETRLGARATLRQSYSDETWRSSAAGTPTSLRFRIAEERLEGRRHAFGTSDLRALVRAQFNRVERQQDLWLGSALAELEHPHPGHVVVSPRAGLNVFSGGFGDGLHAGEALGLALRIEARGVALQLDGSRERTKGTGLRGRLEAGTAGYSPRQVGAQRVHAARAGLSFAAGRLAVSEDFEFQDVENTSLGIDFTTRRVHASASYRFSDRLALDAGGEYSTTENGGIYFSSDYRSASGTLALTARPAGALELRSRGTYGRVPAGAREAYWQIENNLAWHFPSLELSLLHRAERRAPEAAAFDLSRTERLLELRATRNFVSFF
ncbi:MAG: hypothetical protein HZC42_07080 [Candidatus Eisenbacteria bacterium]|nr:hypothetical protein [Candidatus Eisenbacteria bacterium]